MSQPVVRVLLVEDNPGDALLISEMLSESGGNALFRIVQAQSLLSGLDRLSRGNIDLVLLDLSLPDSHGLEGLNAIRTHAPSVPVVVLTGFDSESLASRAVQDGAQEYLLKGTIQGPALVRMLQHAIVRQSMQAESARANSPKEESKVLGFLGVKGGVGTTTVACHTAMELRRVTQEPVLLVDLDLAGNAVGFLTNVTASYSIVDASIDILHLDEDRWRKLVVTGPGGLDIIRAAGAATTDDYQIKAERVPFVLRFVKSLYRWVVVDLGRLSPFPSRLAEEVSRLYVVSTSEVLALSEAKSVATALYQAGCPQDWMKLVLNETPARACFPKEEMERLLGVPVEAMLPECQKDFAESFLAGKRLGESRKFQKAIEDYVAAIRGVAKPAPAKKSLLPFLTGAFRDAPTRA
jgi:Flp pilus assembly CpaE family ATPase